MRIVGAKLATKSPGEDGLGESVQLGPRLPIPRFHVIGFLPTATNRY